jgi:hypothetical protein
MAHRLITLFGCSATAAALASSAVGQLPPSRVLVNRREVKVVFPPDIGRVWGWPAREDSTYVVPYAWGMSVSSMDGPRSLVFSVANRGRTARRFSSLRDLVAAGEGGVCRPGMIMACKPGVTAGVERDHIVLALRNRPIIEQLFAMRPATVQVWRPGTTSESHVSDSVVVEYVAPAIPLPDSVLREEARRRTRAYEASIRSIMRYAYAEGSRSGPIWVALGDSVRIRLSQLDCTYDVCVGTSPTLAGASWNTDDSSIAAPRAHSPPSGIQGWLDPGPALYVAGRRPGRTRLHIDLPPSALDTAPSRAPPQRALLLDVVVTPPVGRFAIAPRPGTVQLGDTIEFRLDAADSTGAPLTNLPAELRVISPIDQRLGTFDGLTSVTFDRAGSWRIVAKLGSHVDTVIVAVSSVPKP